MTLGFLSNCLLPWFLIKIVTAQMPAAKYIQMGNMTPIRSNVPTCPSVPMQYPPNPTFSSLLNNYLPNYNLPLPFTNLPNSPMMPMASHMNVPLPFSNVPPVMPNPPMNPLALPLPTPNMKLSTPASNLFDPTVMNNLAIALHLLILNNLLNPEQDTSKQPNLTENPQPPTPPTYPQNPPPNPPYPQNSPPNPPYPNQQPSYFPEPQEPQTFPPPNSKFLGSSGFAEPSLPSLIGAPVPYNNVKNTPRNSHSLMSPYEALGPGPQTGKDVFAQYGPQNLKADFQSPYNSIMANDNASKDLFSMF